MPQPEQNNSRQDDNQQYALIGHQGTAGTETRRVVVSDDGALYVREQGTSSGGGTSVEIVNGTIGTIQNIGRVHNAGTINALPNIPGGTIGEITNGTVRIAAGTVAVNTPGTITSGTVDANILPLSGVVLAGTLGVGTTATALPASALSGRKSMIVYNEGTARIFLGGSGVGTSTGLPVGTADYSPSFDIGTTILYGICATAGGTARVLEVS